MIFAGESLQVVVRQPFEDWRLADDHGGSEWVVLKINENHCLMRASEGHTAEGGFWFAGDRYTISRVTDCAVNGQKVKLVFASRPGFGMYIARYLMGNNQ